MAPSNQAAYLPSAKANPLQVLPAPYTPPGPGQLVIRNHAIAINPVDYAKQLLGDDLLGYIRYPAILGGDVAGTVVEVGPGASPSRFRVGDRVVGSALGISEDVNDSVEGGFQLYTVLREHMAAPVPEGMSFEQACVIPLTLCTAAFGMFRPDFLGMELPVVPARSAEVEGGKVRAVIITGGSTSVGCNAIQMAVAAGYEVVTTASPRNFEFVKGLGAKHVFDYHDGEGLVGKILTALEGCELRGALAIGEGAADVCAAVLNQHPETVKKFIALANPIAADNVAGVPASFIHLRGSRDPEGPVARIWTDFLPQALAERRFVPAPTPTVVGTGLDKIQEAMGVLMKGVSAQKIVVTL